MAKVSREAVINRRAEIARLALFGGRTQQDIAEALGLDQTTVSKHLKAIRKEWQESAQRDIAEIVAQELRKLDTIELEALTEWERSKKDWKKKVVDKKTGRAGVAEKSEKNETGGQTGDPRYLSVLISIQDRRAKLLGTDKPTKVAPTDPSGERSYESLSDQELAARISELSTKLDQHGAS